MPNGAPPYPDFSQPSVMNPRYGPWITKILGPIIREHQRQQQFAKYFAQAPQQAMAPTTEEQQRALRMGLAFGGGGGITKEERAAWEAENAAYRARNMPSAAERNEWHQAEGWPNVPYQPGTRVSIYPGTSYGTEGEVVEPGAPKAGKPAYPDETSPPSSQHVAVRERDSPYWRWRHINELETLRPHEEFQVGDAVVHQSQQTGTQLEGTVTKPPSTARPAGPDYVWVDMQSRGPVPKSAQGMKAYAGRESFGAWFLKSELTKKGGK